MDPQSQNTLQQPTQTEPTQTNQPPEPQNSKKSHKLLIIASAIVFIVVAVGVVITLLDNKTTQPTNSAVPDPTETNQSQTGESANTVTSVTRGSTTIKITHPSEWVTTENPTDENNGPNPVNVTIISEQGNALRLYSSDGLGGDCDYDNYEFTLKKKLPTATSGHFFTQYTTTSPTMPLTDFKFDSTKYDVSSKTEGSSGTGTCQMLIGYYPFVGNIQTNSDILLRIVPADKEEFDNVTFEDIANDTDFILMLQSIQITE